MENKTVAARTQDLEKKFARAWKNWKTKMETAQWDKVHSLAVDCYYVILLFLLLLLLMFVLLLLLMLLLFMLMFL